MKGKIDFFHILQIFFIYILDKQLRVPLGKGFSVKNTDVLSPDIFLIDGFVSLLGVDVIFFAEKLDFIQGIDIFHSVTCLSDCNVELTYWYFSFLMDVFRNVLSVEYCF